MWHTLTGMGKTVSAVVWPVLPYYVLTLPGIENVQIYETGMTLPDTDLTILLDTAELDRVGLIYQEHHAAIVSRPLIVIDHHHGTTEDGNLNLIVPEAASCAEVLYQLLGALDAPLTIATATCLLLGITTDTQSFQTGSTRPQSLTVAADLLKVGADQQFVVRSVYYSVPFPSVQLLGLALYHVQREQDLIWTHLSQEMLRQVGLVDDTGEDIIQTMQRVAGVRVCVLFKERPDGATKISLRSMAPGIDVAAIASYWNGGGHTKAAGAVLKMSIEAAQRTVLTHLHQIMQL
jgi:bifunctional oligoribonuclease and PAP phosphatase NrnA